MRCRVKPLSTLSVAKRKVASATIPFVPSCLSQPPSLQSLSPPLDGPDLQRQPMACQSSPHNSTLDLDYRVLSDWSPSSVAIAMSLLLSCPLRQRVETMPYDSRSFAFIFSSLSLHRRVD